jgi:hypothetical protein
MTYKRLAARHAPILSELEELGMELAEMMDRVTFHRIGQKSDRTFTSMMEGMEIRVNPKLSRAYGRFCRKKHRRGKVETWIDIQGFVAEFYAADQPGTCPMFKQHRLHMVNALLLHEMVHAYLWWTDHPDGIGHTSTFHWMNNRGRRELGLPPDTNRFFQVHSNTLKERHEEFRDWIDVAVRDEGTPYRALLRRMREGDFLTRARLRAEREAASAPVRVAASTEPIPSGEPEQLRLTLHTPEVKDAMKKLAKRYL